MMTDIELLFATVATDMGRPSSCRAGEQTGEDSSFLECLLGAFNGVGPVMGDATSTDGGEPFPIFCASKGVGWKFREDRPESIQWKGATADSPRGELQKNPVEEVLGTPCPERNDTKVSQVFGRTTKQPGVVNANGSPEIFNGDRSAGGANHAGAASAEVNRAVAGEIRTETVSLPEILRIPGDGASVSSDPALGQGHKSLLAKGPVPASPDGGRAVAGEGRTPTLQNLVRIFQTNHLDPLMGREGNGVLLPDPSASEIGQKRGMRGFVSIGEEGTASTTTQPLTSGETVILRIRPLPAALADGFMQQILENLNVRNWKVGQKDLKIQLHPEEMGRLRMEIGMKDHQVVLKIHVENPLIKDLIENNLAQLREGLLDQGLKMDRCSVTVSDNFLPQSGRNGDNSSGSGDHPFAVDRGETEETPSQRIGSPYGWDSDLVNLFV